MSSMHEAGHSKLVLWDNLEEWSGEGGGRGAQDGQDTVEDERVEVGHPFKHISFSISHTLFSHISMLNISMLNI